VTLREDGLHRDRCMFQLVRQHEAVREQTRETKFLKAGAEAYTFRFG
jgi:hypothetical protein